MGVVFYEDFAGDPNTTIDSVDVNYSAIVLGGNGAADFITSSISGTCGRFSCDGGFAMAQQSLGSTQTVRTLQRYIAISAIPTNANMVILQAENGASSRAQVTVRNTGRFAIRNGSTLVTTANFNIVPGMYYRLIWQINNTTQTLRIYNAGTNELLDTLTGGAGGSFTGFREGIIANPGNAMSVFFDEATDDSTIVIIPPYVPPDSGLDNFIWDGSTQIAVNLFRWDGTNEVPVKTEVA